MPHASKPRVRVKPLRDVVPIAKLAQPRYDGHPSLPQIAFGLPKRQLQGLPKLELLTRTIRSTINGGRLPKYLNGDYLKNLIEEAISLGMHLLDRDDDVLIAGAKSISRKLIHREKHEFRRWEIKDGKRVRTSKADMRIVHPVKRPDENGKLDWVSPLDNIPSASDGRPILSTVNLNHSEAQMIDHLDLLKAQTQRTLQDAIGDDHFKQLQAIDSVLGSENLAWMLEYVTRDDEPSNPLTKAERQKFHRLKQKLEPLRLTALFAAFRNDGRQIQ